MKPTVRIRNAVIHSIRSEDGQEVQYMTGHTLDHPRAELNRLQGVRTSAIVSIRDEGETVETSNTIYKLIKDKLSAPPNWDEIAEDFDGYIDAGAPV